jgi:capsular polysaccharide transport system ATP-binding protein
MIRLEGVSKRYVKNRTTGDWVLRDTTLTIPAPANVIVLGAKGAGKTTLLRLIAGVEPATTGSVAAEGRVAHPTKFMRNLQPLLTGRQNAKFICRINGHAADLTERLARIDAIAKLGPRFDQPAKTYSKSLRARLSFALSWVLDFDVYVADAFNFAGSGGFGDKAVAASELATRLEAAGMISTPLRGESEIQIKQRCSAAIWVHQGQARWFDDVDEALTAFKAAVPPQSGKKGRREERAAPEKFPHLQAAAPDAALPALARIKRIQGALIVLSRGAMGLAPVVDEKNMARLVRLGKDAGIELATRDEFTQRGLHLPEDTAPFLRVVGRGGVDVEYFDLNAHAAAVGGPVQA